MTPQEELELLQLEQERRRRQAAATAAPTEQAPQPAAQAAPTLSKQGIMEVIRDIPGSAREAIAPVLTAPAKIGGFLWDAQRGFKQFANKQSGGRVFPGAEDMPALTPKVDALRDALAGRELGNETPTAVMEGITGGPTGMAMSGAVNEMINRGVNPVVALGASLLVPAAGSAATRAYRAGSVDPRKMLAQGRIEHAVSGTDPAALREAAQLQSLAQKEGIFMLPSQGSGRSMPGIAQLETQALMSSAKGAGPLREQVFAQQGQADDLAKALVAQAGKPTNVEDAATNLQRAAVDRVRADSTREQRITGPYYAEAAKNKASVDPAEIKSAIKAIDDSIKSMRGNEAFEIGARDLKRRLEEISKTPKGDKGAAILGRLTGNKPSTVAAPDLYRVMQSFGSELKAVDARGVAKYEDNVAQALRELAERTVRNLYETKEPAYQTARELTKGMRRIDSRGPFDPLVSMTKANSPENVINQTLKAPDALQEISRGRSVWADLKKPGTDSATPMTETVASNQKAVSEALATALEGARQRAFSLGNTGQRNPSASAKFAREVAGTPTQEEALMRAIQAAGGDPTRSAELLTLNRALGRPSVVQGARVPVTDITPVEGLRMAGGHELARRAAVMRVAQALVNRMSDGEVIRKLQQPDSAARLAQMPQVQTATPREKLAALLAAAPQTMPTE